MTTYLCSTDPDPEKREEPEQLASVDMRRRWTYHAFSVAPDRRSTVLFTGRTRLEVRRGNDIFRFATPKGVFPSGTYWSPDSRYVTGWMGRRALGVMDVRSLVEAQDGGPPPFRLLYESPVQHVPFGIEWSPKGDAVYVIEHLREEGSAFSRLVRVPVKGGEPEQVMRIGGRVDFFMPPVSRFEHGQGPSTKPYQIVFGHPRGLYLLNPESGTVRRAAKLPATGLQNVEWHPRRNELALFFRFAMVNSDGDFFRGLYRFDLDALARGESPEQACEQVYDGLDVHTLWYSPRGTYLTWATREAIYFRKPHAAPEETVIIDGEHEGELLDVRGCSWSHDESKLAYTAGNHLFVYDVAREESRWVTSFGAGASHFAAEPVWVEDRVTLAVFAKRASKKERQILHVKTRKPQPKSRTRGGEEEEADEESAETGDE